MRLEVRQAPSATSNPQHAVAVRKHIFLSYRRDDTRLETSKIYDRLGDVYGRDGVFMDVEAIPGGADFVAHIDDHLRNCAVMLVMIGNSWATIVDRKNRRRISLPNDSVKGEIAKALRHGIPIIPVLVQDAAMPDAEDLPHEIKPLARRNAVAVTNQNWTTDMNRLLKAVNRFVSSAPVPVSPTRTP